MQSEAGTLLVQSGLITEAQLRQALADALQSGSSLIQALVRLGLVPADELARRLSVQLEIPLAEAAQFESLPAFITRLVTAEVVMTHRVIPIMLHRGVLHLAMSDPTNRQALEEISFLTGYSVRPVAAAEPLIEAAMNRFYGIPPDDAIPEMRLLPGLGTRDAVAAPVVDAPPAPVREVPPAPSGPTAAPPPEPEPSWSPPPSSTADGELEELFWGSRADQEVIHLTRPKRGATSEAEEPTAPRNLGEALKVEVLRALEGARNAPRTPPPAPAAPAPVDPSPPPAPSSSDAGGQAAPASPGPEEAPPPEDPELAPLQDSEEARLLIHQATDRDDIARLLVRYARTFLPRAVLMIIKKDVLVGWLGAGVGLNNQRIKGILIPLDSSSVFRTARETATDYFGSMPKGATNDIFLASLGDLRPRQVLLIPINVRHKPICILYGDCALEPGFSLDLSPLHLMTGEAAQAFEKLIIDRKINRLVTR